MFARMGGTRDQFITKLSTLKKQSSLSYALLARKLGRPGSTINDWCNGKHLPYQRDNADFDRLLEILGVDPTERIRWMQWLSELRAGDEPSKAIRNPYLGLSAYTEADASLFFGRRPLVDLLVTRLALATTKSPPTPTIVLGSSGSGKTSLVRAGLVPRTSNTGIETTYLRPFDGQEPIDALLAREVAARGVQRIVIIDQFEEVFAPTPLQRTDRNVPNGNPAIEAYLAAVERLAARADMQLIVAARSDFFPEIAAIAALAPGVSAGPVVVGPPDVATITECIHGPAKHAGLTVDPPLHAEIVREFTHPGTIEQHGALPLLSHVLWMLAEQRTSNTLTYENYMEVGGLQNALGQFADAAFRRIVTKSGDDPIRDLFMELIEVSRDGRPTRRRVTLNAPPSDVGDARSHVISEFTRGRLLTVDRDVVSITHEALIRAWPRLSKWIDDARADLIAARRIRHAAEEWGADGERRDGLLRGSLLDDATRAIASPTTRGQLTSLHHFFVAESVAARTEDDAHEAALLSRQLAMQSRILPASEVSVAAQIALTAHRTSPTPEATSALLSAAESLPGPRFLFEPGYFETFIDPTGRLITTNNPVGGVTIVEQGGKRRSVYPRAGAAIHRAACHGKTLITAHDNGALALIDLDAGTASPLRRDEEKIGPVHAMAATRAATGNTVAVAWARRLSEVDVHTGTERVLARFDDDEPDTVSVAIADGLVATGNRDGIVSLIDTSIDSTTEGRRSWQPSATPCSALLILPELDTIVAGFYDGHVVRITIGDDASDSTLPISTVPCASWINALTVSDDEAMIASASSDGTVRFWSTTSWTEIAAPLRHPSIVTDVAVTADAVITACEDGIVRTWPRPADERAEQLEPGSIWSMTLDDRSDRLLTGSRDNTRLWRLDDGGRPIESSAVTPADGRGLGLLAGSVALAPERPEVFVGGRDGEVIVIDLDADPGTPPVHLDTHLTELVECVGLSPDGRTLAAVDRAGTVDLWKRDPESGRYEPLCSTTVEPPGLGLAVSHAGRLGVVSESGEATVWTIEGDQLTNSLTWSTGDSFALCLAFHPSEPVCVVGNADRTASLWSIDDTRGGVTEIARLTGPAGHVWCAAYNKTGTLLACGSTDGHVWLWDVSRPENPVEIAAIPSGENGVYAVAISDDDRYVYGAGPHERINRWLLDPEEACSRILARCGDTLTPYEWMRLVPERIPFRDLRSPTIN